MKKRTTGEHLALAEAARGDRDWTLIVLKVCILAQLIPPCLDFLVTVVLGVPKELFRRLVGDKVLLYCLGGLAVGVLIRSIDGMVYRWKAGESARVAERFFAWFAEPEQPNLAPSRLSARVGFVLPAADENLEELRDEDAACLRLFFTESAVSAAGEILKADLLFVYARLREDGRLVGSEPKDLRELARLSEARLVVLATDNPEAQVRQAIVRPGSAVNMAFTLDRHEEAMESMLFCAFFHDLFQSMLDGEELLAAWAKLSPRPPISVIPTEPRLILVAEGEPVVFPRAREGADRGLNCLLEI